MANVVQITGLADGQVREREMHGLEGSVSLDVVDELKINNPYFHKDGNRCDLDGCQLCWDLISILNQIHK